MKRALANAMKGLGTVSPNPMVGAVVVKDNIILGEGHHIRSGEGHAEVNAVANCGEKNLEDATIYVTLEPCCHTNKKTPPCTNLLLQKKFKRVVVACLDPNPNVAGNGVKILRDAGVEVVVGVLEKEATLLNEVFFKYIKEKKPFVHLKLAQTLDGKMATMSGDSKWITDENARKIVHEMRLKYDAVMVGRSTLNADDPALDIRMGINSKGKTPYRVIVGSPKNLNLKAKLLNDENVSKTILVVRANEYQSAPNDVLNFLDEKKIKLVFANDLGETLAKLGEMGITSVLIEGGPMLACSIVEQKLFDRISIFIAPKILGEGLSYYKKHSEKMAEALNFKNCEVKVIGKQALFELSAGE
ncbi:bifunctional diaminohydroxyphosphoribosylaminopyrimidine deaminase/5-amino-6-(5-phosphoribosylamino)uracil reductase RibD [Bacteriovorax sp. Seq25_V]|uniref:bifunctional diaminohydroxyphosphoribosylaminopyrimidine deaminase/5-amino-6-(5-phosphoribosylamino)uracil reductase RibD n=1 Tax=Bacteriovorax sp. Seq25_V TaxID=1201288 RepID=UPI00054EEFE2|nr:bifunctional diaminohydroxyphosphoribosylaminopyrimidine deaminase/5-amino-6-(5-phosphoribosylamino)uracil reductase RibD [Bacteriovorax sp. Seq25_V]